MYISFALGSDLAWNHFWRKSCCTMLSPCDGVTNSQEANGRATCSKRQYTIAAGSAVKDNTNAFSCIVLPWCQSTCALTGIELARMHAVHRALWIENKAFRISEDVCNNACKFLRDSLHLPMRSLVLAVVKLFVKTTMEIVLLRILTMLCKHETCTSDYRKLCCCRTLTVARPSSYMAAHDIGIFTDSAATFELLIYIFHTTVLIPLGSKCFLTRSCNYTSNDERDELPMDFVVYTSRNDIIYDQCLTQPPLFSSL